MKNLICLVLAFFFLISCASKATNVGTKKEIAEATQRVGEEYYNSGQYTAALRNLLDAYKTLPDDPFLNTLFIWQNIGLTLLKPTLKKH